MFWCIECFCVFLDIFLSVFRILPSDFQEIYPSLRSSSLGCTVKELAKMVENSVSYARFFSSTNPYKID